MDTIQQYRQKHPELDNIPDQRLGEMLHKQHFPDRDQADFFKEFGVDTPTMAPVSGGMSPEGKLDYDKLSTNKEWLSAAHVIYENETGKKFEKSNEHLDEWMKERQADFNNDLTNIGITAYRSKEFSPEVKQAWVKALDIFDNTGANLESFGKAVRHTITDPLTLGAGLATFGVGSAAKVIGGRAVTFAAKGQFKEQLKRELTETLIKKGLSKEAAEKAAVQTLKGTVVKSLDTAGLTAARKAAAKRAGRTMMVRSGLAGAAYGGIYDMGHQLTNKRIEREGYENIDNKQFAISVLGGAALGGALGRWIPSLSERIGRTSALRKAQVKADQATKVAAKPLERTTRGQVDKNTTLGSLQSLAHKMQDDLEVGGTVKLLVTEGRAATNKLRDKTKKKDWKSAVTDEEVIDTFDSYGIAVTKGKKGQWIGRKIGQQSSPAIPTGEGRNVRQKLLAKFKRRWHADSGLGRLAGESRRLMEADTRRAEMSIKTKFNRLNNAIKNEYDIDDLSGLEQGELSMMDRVLRGNKEARKIFEDAGKTNVLTKLDEMRNAINGLQNKLLKSGAIKSRSELEATIKNSMKGEGDLELYLNKQYEVFDNPRWGKEIRKNAQVMEGASKVLQARAYSHAEKVLKRDLKKIDNAVKDVDADGNTIYNYDKVNASDADFHREHFGENGFVAQAIDSILNVNGEDDLFRLFDGGSEGNPLKAFGKIFEKRKDIPEEIRDLMGEYKDPFTNFANTYMKLNQVLATHKYETEIADLVRRGLIEGAGTEKILAKEIVQPLSSTRPAKIGKEIQEDVAEVKPDRVSPLQGLYGTKEIADAVLFGNEITRTTNGFNDNAFGRGLMKYLALQGHTRMAKTVYSPGSIARNFLGAGWMSLGAGYYRPGHVKAMAKVAKGMTGLSDEQLNAEIEKNTYLGFHQSGAIGPAAYRGALQDAGDEGFWMLNSPVEEGGKALQNRAKRFNMKAVKFYQAMDDVWKQFGFLNEKDNYRKVMVDRAHVARAKRQAGQQLSFEDEQLLDAFRKQGGDVYDPEQDIVHTFKTGDGLTVNITRLDKLAADEVSRHMQNYAGVPQYVRLARLAPAADFLAFNTELARTMKNIWVDTARDIVEGNRLMREGITLPDGSLAGRQQRDVGMRRLGFQISAQVAPSALASTSLIWANLDEEEADAIETFVQPYEKGAEWLYLGPQKDGEGEKLNLSWLNPYAGATDWLRTGMREMGKGPDVEGKIGQAIEDSILNPIYETLGPSMLAEAVVNNLYNIDSYGNTLVKDTDDWDEAAAARFGQLWKSYEPGVIRDAKNIYKSIVDRPEGADYAIKEGRSGRKYKTSHQLTGLLGVKPQKYDIKPQIGYEIAEHQRNMGEAGKIWTNMIQEKSPTTVDELTDSYKESLRKQYRESRRIFDVFSRAKKAGLSDKAIQGILTKGGFFPSGADKKMLMGMFNKGVFIPPPPVSKDAFKWVAFAKSKGASPPPVKEALSELMHVYKNYVGATTGER